MVWYYDRVLAVDPENIDAWNNKGVVLSQPRRYEETIACYNKVLEIYPHHAEALNNNGNLLYLLGRLRIGKVL